MRNGLLTTYAGAVRPEWIDPNGHMNVAYYTLTFDHATSGLYDVLGLGYGDIARTDRSVFAVETHLVYLRELREGEPIGFATQLLGHDDKRLHYYHEMIQPEEGVLAATSENIGVHVDMTVRPLGRLPGRREDQDRGPYGRAQGAAPAETGGTGDFSRRWVAGVMRATLLIVLGLALALGPGAALADCTDLPEPGVDWKRCHMDRRDLQGVDLSDAKLRDASFARTDLSDSILVGADAFRAKFLSADLSNANLEGARLAEADLTKADLSGASLRDANLRRARLYRANLRGADLTGAQMKKAELLDADLSGATWIDGERVCAEGSIGRCR